MCAEEKISRPQRSLKRRTKGSRSWRKVNDRISRLHTKKKNINHDWQHKSSTELLQQYDSIAAEKLSIHRMTKSAGGTAEHPGTHVSAKSGLNRSLLRTCPAEFIRKVEYKAKLKGKRVVLVDPRHTSQRCSRCGYTAPKNRISQAVFICQRCGYSEHADLNAGLNSMMPEVPILFQGGDEWHPDMLRFAWVQRTLLSMRTDRAVRKTR